MSKNPINKSGKELEDNIENFLISEDIPHTRQKKGIDFIINDSIYVEAKNQNGGGSVDEKLPHTVWKYHKQYKINHMIIVHGKHKISKAILNHLEERFPDVKVEFYDFYDFCKMIKGKEIRGVLDV